MYRICYRTENVLGHVSSFKEVPYFSASQQYFLLIFVISWIFHYLWCHETILAEKYAKYFLSTFLCWCLCPNQNWSSVTESLLCMFMWSSYIEQRTLTIFDHGYVKTWKCLPNWMSYGTWLNIFFIRVVFWK